LDTPRSPLKFLKIIKSYFQLRKLVKTIQPELIHSHTPVAGVLGRLVSKEYSLKNIYTAHGFHFYKGSPLLSWMIFYPIERYFSRFCNAIITINKEDYEVAKNQMKGDTYYIPGVGIQSSKYEVVSSINVDEGLSLLCVGELSPRKNHLFVIKAIKERGVELRIAGSGKLHTKLSMYIQANDLADRVQLLGYVDDVSQLYSNNAIFVMPSKQEGLPVAMMEAMASGKAVLASNIRGNSDLIDHGKGGFLFSPDDIDSFLKYLDIMLDNPLMVSKMGEYNREKAKNYDVANIRESMRKIYDSYLS
jgi:glycosyltransferase EpsD